MPLGALPARFRRERVLLIGCGDVGLRVARALRGRMRLLALTSSPDRVPPLRARALAVLPVGRPAWRRLEGASRRPSHVAEMVVTSALIPFLSIYWRLRGAWRFRVLFL